MEELRIAGADPGPWDSIFHGVIEVPYLAAFRLGMLVTNTRFTRDALWTTSRDPARHFLRLRDFADLTCWLHGVFGSELDWREIPDSIELTPGVSVHVPKPRFTEAGIVWPLKNAFEPDA